MTLLMDESAGQTWPERMVKQTDSCKHFGSMANDQQRCTETMNECLPSHLIHCLSLLSSSLSPLLAFMHNFSWDRNGWPAAAFRTDAGTPEESLVTSYRHHLDKSHCKKALVRRRWRY